MKEGKKKGIEKLRKTIKTEAEYLAFASAMDNYLELCKKEGRATKFIMRWKTFCNNWTDYLAADTAKPDFISQAERVLKGEL